MIGPAAELRLAVLAVVAVRMVGRVAHVDHEGDLRVDRVGRAVAPRVPISSWEVATATTLAARSSSGSFESRIRVSPTM
jgi:hypothetical protein